jgi:basic membrane lipoprotein Med (substrate-binding protein (PBP1-ABC) superfamily)
LKTNSMLRVLVTALVGLPLAVACSSKTSGGLGIGSACTTNDQCQNTSCNDGVCTKNCSTDIDCPSPSFCAKGLCQVPLVVGAMYSGSASETEGWTFTNHKSLTDVRDALPYVKFLAPKEQVFGGNQPPLVAPAVTDLIDNQHANVIVATSSDQGKELEAIAPSYPNVKFLYYKEPGSNFFPKDVPTNNLATYTSSPEPAWYVAGKIAVQKTHAKRLGFIGSYINPSVITVINAFTLGARSEDPDVVVEVRWVGFWIDLNDTAQFPYNGSNYFREDLIALQLAEAGAEVIVQHGDSSRPIRLVDARKLQTGTAASPAGTRKPVFTLNTNYRFSWKDLQSNTPLPTCLGSTYFNFTPYLQGQITQIHKGTWAPTDFRGFIEENTDTSMVAFEPNTSAGIDDANVRKIEFSLKGADGFDATYKGPYSSTGQMDLDDDGKYDADQTVHPGQVLTLPQIQHTCWYVKGVVEKVQNDDTPASPQSADQDAFVPDDLHPALNKTIPVPPGSTLNCKKNY